MTVALEHWFEPAPPEGRRLLSTVGARRVAVVAQSGAGKTYAVLRLLELLYGRGSPFVVIDPVGNFWGLRLGKDGKSAGLDVRVLGGAHGDVELPAQSGRAIADFIATSKASLILDISRLDEDERAQFVTELAQRLLVRWSEKRRVLTLVLDEAQEFVPETLEKKADARMRAALRRWALTGRNFGLGLILLTQAPQNVQKRVFNLADLLLVGRLGGEHERAAVERWVKRKGVDGKALLEDLPSLPSGTFYASSPEWLELADKVTVTDRTTYDASKTPELGDEEYDEQALAAVDLGPLMQALRECLPEVSADEEPAPTRGRSTKGSPPAPAPASNGNGYAHSADDRVIAALERELSEVRAELIAREQTIRHLGERNRMLETASLQAYVRLRDVMPESALSPREQASGRDTDAFTAPGSLAGSFRAPSLSPPAAPRVLRTGEVLPVPSGVNPDRLINEQASRVTVEGESKVKDAYRQDLLATLCTYGPMNRERLSLLSGKSRTSTSFASAIRWLVQAQLITDVDGVMKATIEGQRQSRVEPLPLGRALYDHWRRKLNPYDAEGFDEIAKVRGGLSRAQISERTGHSQTSTSFARTIRTLKAMGLAGEVKGKVFLLDHVRTSMGLS